VVKERCYLCWCRAFCHSHRILPFFCEAYGSPDDAMLGRNRGINDGARRNSANDVPMLAVRNGSIASIATFLASSPQAKKQFEFPRRAAVDLPWRPLNPNAQVADIGFNLSVFWTRFCTTQFIPIRSRHTTRYRNMYVATP
jgi:hypothetical protein